MIIFPNCKINLGLHIVRKRNDGFHDLETIFYPLPVRDILEIIKDETGTVPVSFTLSGLPVDGDMENNLCIKAYHLLKQDYPQISSIKMHLHKIIPMGAGLGGGSSDAANTLQILNSLYELDLTHAQLVEYALKLGSDCPFFILNKPCFAKGRGEQMEEIALDLSQYSFVLVNPGIHINTRWAFSTIIPRELQPSPPKESLKEALQLPISDWKDHLVNDFEQPVFDLYPEIKDIRDTLYNNGAIYSSMTGSGSTVFGIFQHPAGIIFNPDYRVITV